jgi:hypothetical protein
MKTVVSVAYVSLQIKLHAMQLLKKGKKANYKIKTEVIHQLCMQTTHLFSSGELRNSCNRTACADPSDNFKRHG